MKIIGREHECSRLDSCMNSDAAQLVIVYGRRRIGKTFLINKYFNNNFAFKITGIYNYKKKEQIKNFIETLNEYANTDYKDIQSWYDAFRLLKKYIKTLPTDKKQVLFFDEMPWMDNKGSDFLSSFEWFWNDFAQTLDNICIIVCGSATSWMNDNIQNNKGGLFNRQTCTLYLKPFTLSETEKYLESKEIHYTRYEIVECYMAMGGIPYYLSLLNKELSLKQNINYLFFSYDGELRKEFNHLYKTLFTNSKSYINVVETLAKVKNGITREDLVDMLEKKSGGSLSKILEDLELSGFIQVSNFYGKKTKNKIYSLCDYYTLFYFKFLKENKGYDDNFWTNSIDNPAITAWRGLTFEKICIDHISNIKNALGISGILSQQNSWFTKPDEENDIPGAQIDMLIDRRDNTISICEIKYSSSKYLITKDYELNLRNKIEVFKQQTKTNKSLQLIMITNFGLSNSKYNGIVTKSITLDDLFKDL